MIEALQVKAAQIRVDLLNMIYEAKTGHTGGSLSCTDILVALYYGVMRVDPSNPEWEDRDRFILSKGHSVEGYYCILGDLGFFPKEELKTFSKFGSRFIGHPNNKVPGVEMNTGALGHGLSISVGMALAAKMKGKDYRVFTLMGDGEQAEGSVWEAAMAAAHHRLGNLTAIVDRNGVQIDGPTESVMRLEPLAEKWKSFGWQVVRCNGNRTGEILEAFSTARNPRSAPMVVIAQTVMGKGIPAIEGDYRWHGKAPSKEELERFLRELA